MNSDSFRFWRLIIMLTLPNNWRDSDVVHIKTYKHLDATQAKHPGPTHIKRCDGLIWWNQLKHASGVLCPVACVCRFCALCASACPQEGIQIHIWSRRGEPGEVWQQGRVPTCKIDVRRWGTREERGMRGWIKQSLSLTGGTFKNFKTSFTPEDGLCACVWACQCAHKCIFPCIWEFVCVLCVSVHIRVIQYPYRGQCLPCLLPQTYNHDEQMKNELKNNRRKGERQNKQWERAVAPNSRVASANVYMDVCVCAHMKDVFILWFTLCPSFKRIFILRVCVSIGYLVHLSGRWLCGGLISHKGKQKSVSQTKKIRKRLRKMHRTPVCHAGPCYINIWKVILPCTKQYV